MSRNRLLAVFAAVLASLVAFLVWQHVDPARAVNTGGAMTPGTSAAPKTGTVEH